MLFKRYALLILALLLCGCSLRVNDEVEKQKVEVKVGCLSSTGAVIQRYANGTGTEAEHKEFWDCVEKAFNTFYSHTAGAAADSYRPSELSGFLTKYFLNGQEIRPELVGEAMILKQAMIGGRTDMITRKELRETLELIKVLRQVSQEIRPHMPFQLAAFKERNYSPAQFEAALGAYDKGFQQLSAALEGKQTSYTFDQATRLLEQLKIFLYSGKDSWVDSVLRWQSAMRPAKALLISPPKDEISASDWPKIYRLAPRYYAFYLRARFYINPDYDFLSGKGRESLEKIFDEAASLMEAVLDEHPNATVKSKEIEEFLDALDSHDMLPIRLETAKALSKVLFGKLFGKATGSSYTVTRANFRQLRENFYFASEGLRAIEAIYRERFGDKFSEGRMKSADIAALRVEPLLEATARKNSLSREAVESVLETAADINTVFPGDANVVLIPEGRARPMLSQQHLAKFHLMRSLNRLLLSAYGKPGADLLQEKEIGALADDIFPVLEDIGFADAETRKTVPKRLFEASLFLHSSDGSASLKMTEGLEFQSLLISTLMHAQKVHRILSATCHASGKDERGRISIPADCFRKQWLKSQHDIWAYIPGFAKYFARLSQREQELVFGRLEGFLRKGRPKNSDFTLSDTRSFILLPYYVELLFSRFDKNQDGVLENLEAETAYPVFRPFLKTKAERLGKNNPSDHHAIYMYLLAYRSLPSKDNWKSSLAYVWHRYIAGDKNFRIDRGHVIEIFEKLLTL